MRAILAALLAGCTPQLAIPPSDGSIESGIDTSVSVEDAAEPSDAPPRDVAEPDAPSAEFDCANAGDDDGDGAIDCDDSDCVGRACDDGLACTGGDTCGPDGCVGSPGVAVHRCVGAGGAEHYTLGACDVSTTPCGSDVGIAWRVPPDPAGPTTTLHEWATWPDCGSGACGNRDACSDVVLTTSAAAPTPGLCHATLASGPYPTEAGDGLVLLRRVGNDAGCRHFVIREDEPFPADAVVLADLGYVCPP